jgi:hypothetical protein
LEIELKNNLKILLYAFQKPPFGGFFCFMYKISRGIKTVRILFYSQIFIFMGKLNKKIVVRVTQRQLEYLVEETLKQNKSISQVVRKALVEQLIKKL